MRLWRTLRKFLRGSPLSAVDGDEKRYRCIKCGERFEKSHAACPSCGSSFVADTED